MHADVRCWHERWQLRARGHNWDGRVRTHSIHLHAYVTAKSGQPHIRRVGSRPHSKHNSNTGLDVQSASASYPDAQNPSVHRNFNSDTAASGNIDPSLAVLVDKQNMPSALH